MNRFASYFWPREGVNHTRLIEIHQKMVRGKLCIKRERADG